MLGALIPRTDPSPMATLQMPPACRLPAANTGEEYGGGDWFQVQFANRVLGQMPAADHQIAPPQAWFVHFGVSGARPNP